MALYAFDGTLNENEELEKQQMLLDLLIFIKSNRQLLKRDMRLGIDAKYKT